MALKYVLSVRDRAADSFSQPMFVPAVGMGLRAFGDEINRVAPDNQLNRHPEDYDLYRLGTFDDMTGVFECSTPQMLVVGKDLVRTEK